MTLYFFPLQGGCCSRVRLDSTGSLPESLQAHVIGNYNFYGQGEDGTVMYQQETGDNLYLYYYAPLQVHNISSVSNFINDGKY